MDKNAKFCPKCGEEQPAIEEPVVMEAEVVEQNNENKTEETVEQNDESKTEEAQVEVQESAEPVTNSDVVENESNTDENNNQE